MKFALNQKQLEYVNSKAINTGFVAGLGSGKSYSATLKTILKKIEKPTSIVAYYLPTFPLVRDIAFAKFPEMLADMNIEYKLNKTDKEINITGLGKIVFRSMDNPETIVGYEVFYSVIDECDMLKAEKMETAYNKIMARNRQVIKVEDIEVIDKYNSDEIMPVGMYLHKKLKVLCYSNQLDVVGTPEGFKWFYKRFVKEFEPKTDLLIRASTYDNKHLPTQYIANLEQQYPPNLLRAYLSGEFVNLNSENIYSYFNREIHHKAIEIQDHETIHCGQDFNYNGCITTLFVIRDDTPMQFGEIISKDTYGIVSNLKDRFKSQTIIIYPDASGKAHKTNATLTDIEILKQGGLQVRASSTNPRVQDRINSVNALFSHNRLYIDIDKCPRTAEALEQQSYDDKGEPEKYAGSATIDDFTDSLGYFIYYKFPLKRNTVSQTDFML